MFIVIHNFSTDKNTSLEHRAVSSAEMMQRIVIREVSEYLPPNWSYKHYCEIYLSRPRPGNCFKQHSLYVLTPDVWKQRPAKGCFIKAYIYEKLSHELAKDARRLAVAMAFDHRTSGESKLAQVDMLALQLILKFAKLA